jgi:predicted ester cyclase
MENSDVVREFYKIVGSGTLADLTTVVAPDVVVHGYDVKQPLGLKDMLGFYGRLQASFPDAAFTLNQLVSENDLVSDCVVLTGTQSGQEYPGLPQATTINFAGVSMSRISNGLIVERWATSGTWL